MTGKTDFFFRHDQVQRRHVALCLGQMADRAGNRHGGMHRLASGLIRVTGGTIGISGEDARVLDGGCLCGGDQQQKKTNQRTGCVFHCKLLPRPAMSMQGAKSHSNNAFISCRYRFEHVGG
jgi:hypothetical protein